MNMKSVPGGIFYGWWVVVGAFLVVFVGYGTFYSFPVFYPSFVQQFGWSRTEVSLAGALALLVTGLVSPLVGMLADRWGARFTMIVGTVLVALAMVSIGQVQQLYQLYTAALVFGMGLAGFSILPVQMLAAKWFSRKRGLATGLVISGMGLGGTASPLVVTALLATYSWRVAFLWQATFLLLVSLPVTLWVLRERPSDMGLQPDGATWSDPPPVTGEQRTSALTEGFLFRKAIRTAAFWFLSLSSFCAMFAAIAVIQHLVLYLRGHGLELSFASRILSVLLLASVAGRVGLGHLSDFLTRRCTLLLAYGLLTVGTSLLLLLQSDWGLMVMAVLVGLGYGGSIVLLTLTAAEVFGNRSMGRILGTILVFFTAGGSLGPVAVGYLSDRFGDYRYAFGIVLLAALAAVLSALGVRLRPSASVPANKVRAAPA